MSGCGCWTRRRMLGAMGLAPVALAGCSGGDLTLNIVPEAQVEAAGRQEWAKIRANTPVTRNASFRRSVARSADRLLRAAGEDPRAWEVVAFGSPEANAFALPGNKIGVFEGMARVSSREDELAAVIGHEIGHVQAEHPEERVNAQAATGLVRDLAGALVGQGDPNSAQAISAALGVGAQVGVLLPFSRRQELEADRLGVVIMDRAGYDPRAALAFWQRAQARGRNGGAFLSTHPAPGDRIAAIEGMIASL